PKEAHGPARHRGSRRHRARTHRDDGRPSGGTGTLCPRGAPPWLPGTRLRGPLTSEAWWAPAMRPGELGCPGSPGRSGEARLAVGLGPHHRDGEGLGHAEDGTVLVADAERHLAGLRAEGDLEGGRLLGHEPLRSAL